MSGGCTRNPTSWRVRLRRRATAQPLDPKQELLALAEIIAQQQQPAAGPAAVEELAKGAVALLVKGEIERPRMARESAAPMPTSAPERTEHETSGL